MPERIAALTLATPGVELCGLLLADRQDSIVNEFVCSPGPFRSDTFELCPSWLLSESLYQRSQGRRTVGYFHTHPDGQEVEPSLSDRLGHPPCSIVLIVGVERWQAYRTGWELEEWTPVSQGTFAPHQGFPE